MSFPRHIDFDGPTVADLQEPAILAQAGVKEMLSHFCRTARIGVIGRWRIVRIIEHLADYLEDFRPLGCEREIVKKLLEQAFQDGDVADVRRRRQRPEQRERNDIKQAHRSTSHRTLGLLYHKLAQTNKYCPYA